MGYYLEFSTLITRKHDKIRFCMYFIILIIFLIFEGFNFSNHICLARLHGRLPNLYQNDQIINGSFETSKINTGF